jgi:hypothetical protein
MLEYTGCRLNSGNCHKHMKGRSDEKEEKEEEGFHGVQGSPRKSKAVQGIQREVRFRQDSNVDLQYFGK